ncbi:MAG: Tetratricopeptide repeat [Fibrobacterota bacterium]
MAGGAGIALLVAVASFAWTRATGSAIRPSNVPLGFVGDTTLFKGRSVDLPGKLKEASEADRGLLLRAIESEKTGDRDRALEMVDEVLRRSPELPEAWYYAAAWRQQKRTGTDSTKADTLISKGLAKDPGHPWLLLLQARRQAQQGKLKEARETLTKVLDFAPTFRIAMEELAVIELRAGDPVRAQRLAQLSVSIAPRAEARYDLLAEIFFARERDDSAREAVKVGMEANPSEPRYLWIRGLLAESRGDTTSARKDYVSALAKGKLPQAEDALRTLGLKPIHGRGRMGASFGGQNTIQTGFAVELLTPLVRTYPRSAPLLYALARSLQEQGYLAQADESYHKALAIDSTVPGLVEWARENRKQLDAKAKVFANARIDSTKAAASEDTRWYDLGHYRFAWGISRDQFIGQFPAGRFEKPTPATLQERRSMWGIEHLHTVRFDSSGLWAVMVSLQDAGKASVDLLEEGIRLNALQAGSGTFNESKFCPGWGQVESVWWETADTYEFMVIRPAKQHVLGLIRLRKDRVPDGGLCGLVPLALDSTLR